MTRQERCDLVLCVILALCVACAIIIMIGEIGR